MLRCTESTEAIWLEATRRNSNWNLRNILQVNTYNSVASCQTMSFWYPRLIFLRWIILVSSCHSTIPLFHYSTIPSFYSPLLGKSLRLQPEDAVARPRMPLLGVPIASAQANPVLAFLIDVQITRDPGFAERFGKLEAVLDRHCIVFIRVPDEAGRRLFGDLEFIREQANQFGRGVVAQ